VKNILKRAHRDQNGAALTLVLVLLVVGGLILAPLLGLMSTGLMAGRVYENNMHSLYAADAGIEDGLWQIRNEELGDHFSSYDAYDYSGQWSYYLDNHQRDGGGVAQAVLVNDKGVNVTIENVWIPMDIPTPDPDTAREIAEGSPGNPPKLIITGSVAGATKYEIKISYDQCWVNSENPAVTSVGVWLPTGFEYVMGSSDLEAAIGKAYYSVPGVVPWSGGYAVVWNFTSPYPTLGSFPTSFSFQYSGPQGQTPDATVPWINIGIGSAASGSQTRYPSGDVSRSGTWDKTTNMYTYVDEKGTNDADTTYLLHGTTSGYALFSFPIFTVPTGATIQSLTVSLVARDYNCSFLCSNSMQPAIRVGGTNYLTTSRAGDPRSSYSTFSYTYTTNPKTNTAWTLNDVNGVGPNALQGFGVYSTDANPQIRLTQVYAEVSYVAPVNFASTSYTWGADVKVYKITSTATDPETGKQTTVESYTSKVELRKLGSAISGDYVASGNTLMVATTHIEYRDTLYEQSSCTFQSSNPSAPGYIPPDATVGAAFVYWSGWIDWHYPGSSSSGITALKYSSDTSPDKHILVSQTAKVDTVDFGVAGSMATVTAGKCQVEENSGSGWGTNTGTADTWSYACFADVTSLVRDFIAAGGTSSNGAGMYALSQIPENRSGTESQYSFSFSDTGETTGYPLGTPAPPRSPATRYQYAYAGWSLVIIYTSPETKGHQLYAYGVQTGDFAFINGQASGGDEVNIPISGFLAPDDTTGSHMTCFVGEGDAHYGCKCGACTDVKHTGDDYLEVNGNGLSDGICCACNVWNSYSNVLGGTAVNGVDIDDFDMSSCIKPYDSSATVTVGSKYDIYNVVYIFLSFRSSITTGGTLSYLIKG